MSSRTFEELKNAVNHAKFTNDGVALLQCADELEALGMPVADALAGYARGGADVLYGQYQDALEHYQRALIAFEELGNLSGVEIVTLNIGTVHRHTNNYSTALEYFRRVLAFHDALGNRSNLAAATTNIGCVLSETGDYPGALEYFHKALILREESGDRIQAAGVVCNIGLVYLHTDNYPSALEHFHRALVMNEESGNRSWMADTISNIGSVLLLTGNYPAALEHYHRALDIHEALDHRSGMARLTSNIGELHVRMGDHRRALEYYHRALAIHEMLGERGPMALTTANIVDALIASGMYDEAEELQKRMDAIQTDSPQTLLHKELNRALLLEHRGDLESARTTLQGALSIARERMLAQGESDVHKILRDIALKQNDLAAYVRHNNEYTRIIEEINGKDTATKLAMQEKQREIDVKDREHQKQLAVLHSTLPKHVAERVARGEVVNDQFENATVIFLDIVGFTELSSRMTSQDVITLLDTIFTQCDALCEQHNVTKIKTIGDSYMCVSFDSVVNAAHCALAMSQINVSHEVSHNVLFRIGLHCGPVTAGVIGTQRMQYDVWGDTVNVASRMESSGEAGRVHVSEAFAVQLEEALVTRHSSLVTPSESLVTQRRGSIDVKGKGPMNTYWLEARAE